MHVISIQWNNFILNWRKIDQSVSFFNIPLVARTFHYRISKSFLCKSNKYWTHGCNFIRNQFKSFLVDIAFIWYYDKTTNHIFSIFKMTFLHSWFNFSPVMFKTGIIWIISLYFEKIDEIMITWTVSFIFTAWSTFPYITSFKTHVWVYINHV